MDQLIRYSRACSYYECCILRAVRIWCKLLRQEYVRERFNCPSGSSVVDMGISSNIMKSPSPRCYVSFWNIHLQWQPPLIRHFISSDLVTELDLITVCDVITLFREDSIRHLYRVPMTMLSSVTIHLKLLLFKTQNTIFLYKASVYL